MRPSPVTVQVNFCPYYDDKLQREKAQKYSDFHRHTTIILLRSCTASTPHPFRRRDEESVSVDAQGERNPRIDRATDKLTEAALPQLNV